jgi:tetratricopeptide (TPR) repeat protein
LTILENSKLIIMKLLYKSMKSLKVFFFLIILICVSSCKKFLDQKPKITDLVPRSLNDLQTLLDNTYYVNKLGAAGLSELVADNYYTSPGDFQQFVSIGTPDPSNYVWDPQAIPFTKYWTNPYNGPIYVSNIVLDQLPKVVKAPGEEQKFNTIKGSALFYRAFHFHGLAQLFCKPYSKENLASPGIVLKSSSNVTEAYGRSTVEETYDRIIADLKEAASLLPVNNGVLTRPTKTAAYAALARVYLSMRDYVNAAQYANMALQEYGTLMDYNTLLPIANQPIPTPFNPEVIYQDISPLALIIASSSHNIDTLLYQSYDVNDLRKTVFFRFNSGKGTYFFQGSYFGPQDPNNIFDGLATDELYLIRAECLARASNKDAALADLNTLLSKRWKKTVAYPAVTATDASQALIKILAERRKELVWRGMRWSDIRRLNLEGANITLTRNIAGKIYTLPPNDPRSVMLIPWEEINLSGIEQNQR